VTAADLADQGLRLAFAPPEDDAASAPHGNQPQQ
jgi:hypothetical protein